METYIDLNENYLYQEYPEILDILLRDNTTNQYLIWGTTLYHKLGKEYDMNKQMLPSLVIKKDGKIIKPRILKTQKEQKMRSKEMAEVFTPAWICNSQNNLVDDYWFNKKNVFNKPIGTSWKTTKTKIDFKNKNWKDYILENRLEITCGEAPYIVSRYDVVNNVYIQPKNRIGFLDRKIRVINENVSNDNEWYKWIIKAFQHSYGYDFQGDNVLLARENLLLSFVDYYLERFKVLPSKEQMIEISKIISWNIWQMDGIKMVVPNSCKKKKTIQYDMFGNKKTLIQKCEGCVKNNLKLHNGIKCKIKDWDKNEEIQFIDLMKGKK